ncbi:MAG: GNAT family N-acetyltransferase, partial [Nocardioidaceae bacterium]
MFDRDWPTLLDPAVFAHDHGEWETNYHQEVAGLHDPEHDRFVTLAEEDGRILGFVGWNVTNADSGRLDLVAVDSPARCRGVGHA